jgi:hypothetical protein
MNSGSASGDVSQKQAENTVQNKNEAGVADESAFPDTAEGTLVNIRN